MDFYFEVTLEFHEEFSTKINRVGWPTEIDRCRLSLIGGVNRTSCSDSARGGRDLGEQDRMMGGQI